MSNNPTKNIQWSELQKHHSHAKNLHMRSLFESDEKRFESFHIRDNGVLFDYSKNIITKETIEKLLALANACGLEKNRDAMFSGEKINSTENRAVLHTALRAPKGQKVIVEGEDISPFIHSTLDRMKDFSNSVRSGSWKGHSGKPIKYIVNIGIGGSDLGPYMVCEALKHLIPSHIKMFFVSNVDGAHLSETLKLISAEETLFIIASKTFTTQETMANARAAKEWLLKSLGSIDSISKHFCALSTNESAVESFGIDKSNMFPFRDWVGGRYSLWSSIGLSICMAVGFDEFEKLLAGGRAADAHFTSAPLEKNIPVIMALLGIWYRNFWNFSAIAILPYDQYLHRFPAFLQQMDMESNGKNVDRDGNFITDYNTGPVLFGEPGTNGQHAFYQLIHQGRDIIPCDFIGSKKSFSSIGNQHTLLLENMLAQAQALMQGRTIEEAQGYSPRVFGGNRPSNILLFDEMNAFNLGYLIATYEHKVFTQGIIWNINSFDQFGVELGKELANALGRGDETRLDCSTRALLQTIKQ